MIGAALIPREFSGNWLRMLPVAMRTKVRSVIGWEATIEPAPAAP